MLAQFGRWKVVVGTEATVFGEHFDGALVQEVLVFTEAFRPHISACIESSFYIPFVDLTFGLPIRPR